MKKANDLRYSPLYHVALPNRSFEKIKPTCMDLP